MRTNKKRVASSSVLTLTILILVLFNGCTPSGPRAVLDGAKLLREGRPQQAVPRLEEGVRQLPKNAQAWNYLGLAYHQSGRHTNAARAYQQALALDRNLSAVRFNLGCLSLDQGNAAGAVSEFTTFTVLQPGSAAGWAKLGTAQLRTRQLDAAERSFAQALKLDPASPEAWNGMGLIMVQRRRYLDALNQFQGALRARSDYAPALFNAAIVLLQNLNNRPAALQRFREYLAVKPAPANSTSVREVVDQLELELHPPARPANTNAGPTLAGSTQRQDTNLPSQKPQSAVVTNKPAVSATGPIASGATVPNPSTSVNTAAVLTVTPPARLANTNPIPANTLPAVALSPQPAPAEVVQVPREDPIQPVRELPSATSNHTASANTNGLRPVQSPTPTAGTMSTTPDTSSVKPSESKTKQKQPLIKKLNPVNWFRSKNPDVGTGSQTPLASAGVASVPEVTRIPSVSSGTDKTSESSPLTTARTSARDPGYTYHSFGKPNLGNRSEAERWVTTGVKARDRNRLSEALDAFQKAVAADPSLFEAQYNFGVAAFESGDYQKALPAYELALVINPDSMRARYNFAITLQKAGFPQDAANELESVVAKSPGEAAAHLELANLYAGPLNEPARAREHYSIFLRLQPKSPQAGPVRYWLETHP